MHELKMFAFEEKEISTVIMDNELYFVGKDVADVLGYSNASKALNDHCKALKTLKNNDSFVLEAGLNVPSRGLLIIPERDVYRLVMRSKKPEAERFEEWVVSEVLPSIRKTGSYQVQQKPQSSLDVLQGMIDSLRDQEERMGRLESKVDAISKGEAFFSVVGYANLRKVRLDQAKTSAIGKMATKLCKREGIETGSAPHPLYGEVNTYPAEILDLAFDLS